MRYQCLLGLVGTSRNRNRKPLNQEVMVLEDAARLPRNRMETPYLLEGKIISRLHQLTSVNHITIKFTYFALSS